MDMKEIKKGEVKMAVVWPPQAVVIESLHRHYQGLGEPVGYLIHKSKLFRNYGIDIAIHDCAVKPYTAMNMAKIVYDNDIIAICVNLNNIIEATTTATFFKSISVTKKIIAYGEAVCCNPNYFMKSNLFDYVISNGQYELGFEVVIADYYNLDKEFLHPLLHEDDSYYIKDNIVLFSPKVKLPPEDWGIPEMDKLPIEQYISIGDGETHITACKGCPFGCEFCNEQYVSTKSLRYRPVGQVVEFLLNSKSRFKSAYLDSSTFTYDKAWVLELCNELIKHGGKVIPWKTCTRLDCIDEEIIYYMGKANCERISIGVESIDYEIQKRNKKIIDFDKLENFATMCSENGIKPRALFIIGLKGQTAEGIISTKKIFDDLNIDTRFRILQDFEFMVNGEEITAEKLIKLNRWVVSNPLDGVDTNFVRRLEFPAEKNKNFA